MAVYEVFSHPEFRRYKTHICSAATIIQLFCIVLTFIPPWFIAFYSRGFWQKVDTYQEQPYVDFKHQLLTVLHTSTTGDYVAWSTYSNFNQLQMNHFRVPLIKSREDDINGDGKKDVLHLQLDMPLLDTEHVYGAQLILVFDYKLYKYSSLQMESMVYIEQMSPIPGVALETVGDLRFEQKEPLGSRGIDTRFNHSVINSSSMYAEDYDLSFIFRNYSSRNASTILANAMPVWVSGRGAEQPFVLKVTVNYPTENFLYTPGFWQEIKQGWIQYLAILLIFLFVFDRIKIFIYENQLVTTIVDRPWTKAGKAC